MSDPGVWATAAMITAAIFGVINIKSDTGGWGTIIVGFLFVLLGFPLMMMHPLLGYSAGVIGSGIACYPLPKKWYEAWLEYKGAEDPPVPEPEVKPEPEPEKPSIPDELRFEHTLILGASGHGKTQLLSEFIAKDLTKPCSIVVFDSQGDLIHKILKVDFPRSRAVVIDPTDIQFPVALGLFDFQTEGVTPYERERNLNSVIELLTFVLNSLLDARLTSKQDVTLRFVIRLCLVIPDATIHTLRDIFSDGFHKYTEHLPKLSETAQQFFRSEFQSKQFIETREQILRRIYSILENQTIERMFSHPKSKLRMGEILNEGSIVLINSAKNLLKEEGSAFFSRFMVATLAQAIQERTPGDNLPVFIYIDEAAPIIDENITGILETARKYKVGLTLAFQSLGQIPHDLQHSIITNTAIK